MTVLTSPRVVTIGGRPGVALLSSSWESRETAMTGQLAEGRTVTETTGGRGRGHRRVPA